MGTKDQVKTSFCTEWFRKAIIEMMQEDLKNNGGGNTAGGGGLQI